MFLEFWLHFGNQFLHKMEGPVESLPFFFGLRCGTPFLARHGGGYPIGPIPKWLDFGGFGPRFWRFWDSILRCFRHDLAPICSAKLVIFGCSFLKLPLVIGGLVGLREASRISICGIFANIILFFSYLHACL